MFNIGILCQVEDTSSQVGQVEDTVRYITYYLSPLPGEVFNCTSTADHFLMLILELTSGFSFFNEKVTSEEEWYNETFLILIHLENMM